MNEMRQEMDFWTQHDISFVIGLVLFPRITLLYFGLIPAMQVFPDFWDASCPKDVPDRNVNRGLLANEFDSCCNLLDFGYRYRYHRTDCQGRDAEGYVGEPPRLFGVNALGRIHAHLF
jgi:hypothetical protein